MENGKTIKNMEEEDMKWKAKDKSMKDIGWMMSKMEISHKSEIKINSESQDTIQRETKMEFSFTIAWKLDRKSDKKYGRKE